MLVEVPGSLPLGQQAVRREVARPVDILGKVSKFGLDGVRGQQHCGLWGAVHLVTQDPVLHLQEEHLLGDLLDQLLRHILWEELGPELELERVLLLHVLGRHLGGREVSFFVNDYIILNESFV